MKNIAIALTVTSLFASVSVSAAPQLTPAQVIAERADALASGITPAYDNSYAGARIASLQGDIVERELSDEPESSRLS